MNTPDKTNRPDQGPECASETENLRGVYVLVDGVPDLTVRPIDSPVLKQIRPDQPPERPKPEAK